VALLGPIHSATVRPQFGGNRTSEITLESSRIPLPCDRLESPAKARRIVSGRTDAGSVGNRQGFGCSGPGQGIFWGVLCRPFVVLV